MSDINFGCEAYTVLQRLFQHVSLLPDSLEPGSLVGNRVKKLASGAGRVKRAARGLGKGRGCQALSPPPLPSPCAARFTRRFFTVFPTKEPGPRLSTRRCI